MAAAEEDHGDLYATLGLLPGLDGGMASSSEAIRKAYRSKALTCHPDKRPDDPLAAAEFQKLQKAYEILSDETARRAYDTLLNVRKSRIKKESQADSKRRKMMEDLRRRESANVAASEEKDEEEKAFKRLQEEIARIRARNAKKTTSLFAAEPRQKTETSKESGADQNTVKNKEKMLKVSWLSSESGGSEYSAARLQQIFSQFGHVEDVVIRMKSSGKKNSALVVMSCRDDVIAATKNPCGDLSNPILVVPLVPHTTSSFSQETPSVSTASDNSVDVSTQNIVGSTYHDYEHSILERMRKRAEQLKSDS